MTILEGLESIPWRQLHHAYGSAEDVPALIRDLASEDARTRSTAAQELCGNIYHQGTVYQATAFAIPFLAELIRAELPHPQEAVQVFSIVAEGAATQRQISASGRSTVTGQIERSSIEEATWAEGVLRSLRDECDALLDHRTSDWRYLVAVVLAVSAGCPDQATRLLPRVDETLAGEASADRRRVWEVALFALGQRDQNGWKAIEEVLGYYDKDEAANDIAAVRESRWDAPTPQTILFYALEEAWDSL